MSRATDTDDTLPPQDLWGDAQNSAPFPSAVIVFRPQSFTLTAWDANADA